MQQSRLRGKGEGEVRGGGNMGGGGSAKIHRPQREHKDNGVNVLDIVSQKTGKTESEKG